jgi:hypothetical protein
MTTLLAVDFPHTSQVCPHCRRLAAFDPVLAWRLVVHLDLAVWRTGRFWRALGAIDVRRWAADHSWPRVSKVGLLGLIRGRRRFGSPPYRPSQVKATCGHPLTNGSKNSWLSLYVLG